MAKSQKSNRQHQLLREQFKEESFPIVEVFWEDITASSAWNDLDNLLAALQAPLVKTTGYLVHQDKDYTKVAWSLTPELKTTHLKVIPTGCVKGIFVLHNPRHKVSSAPKKA
jgi:hypothetical protein